MGIRMAGQTRKLHTINHHRRTLVEKLTAAQITGIAHLNAREMLKLLMENQSQLFAPQYPSSDAGEGAGQFLNALYDQLVVLNERSSRQQAAGN